MAEPRWIVVDDKDSGIKYYPASSTPWFSVSTEGALDAVGNFGPAYRSTLHGTHSNASLSFNFTGQHLLKSSRAIF